MTRRRPPSIRLTSRHIVAGTLALVALAAGGCGSDEGADDRVLTTPASTPNAVTAPAGEQDPLPPAQRRRVTIDLRNGRPADGAPTLSFARNERVDVLVRSDRAVDVRVPAYGVAIDVPAGGQGLLSFPAERSGTFSMVLHPTGRRIARLVVGG